jgi:hypothetical protein
MAFLALLKKKALRQNVSKMPFFVTFDPIAGP